MPIKEKGLCAQISGEKKRQVECFLANDKHNINCLYNHDKFNIRMKV